jgi:hypothetical protein
MTDPRRDRTRDPPVYSSFLVYLKFIIRSFDVYLAPEDVIFGGAGSSPDNPPQNSGLTNQPGFCDGWLAGPRRCLLHQFVSVTDGNRQVRAAEIIQDGEIYANHFAIAIEERPARAARGGRRIVNNLVL